MLVQQVPRRPASGNRTFRGHDMVKDIERVGGLVEGSQTGRYLAALSHDPVVLALGCTSGPSLARTLSSDDVREPLIRADPAEVEASAAGLALGADVAV